MGSPFVYVQLQTQDLESAKEFYAQLFNWELDEHQTPVGPYAEILAGGDKIGGMVGHRDKEKPPYWVPYVKVTDINATSEKAKTLGATVLQGPMQLPDKTWFCLIMDTTGATFGLHQPAQ
jgi:uncharacterized protein